MASSLWQSVKASLDTVLLTCWVVGGWGVGLVVVLTQHRGATAVLWALASAVCGGVVGFLFGIPRVLQQDLAPEPRPAGTPTEATDRAGNRYRLQVNTNLEQISDWLTKIIVGVGLIELSRVPELLGKASKFIGDGFTSAPGATLAAESFAAAIIVYFSVSGFFGGYLLTRVYLSGAFKRADEGVLVNVAGRALTVEEVNTQIRSSIGDLQSQVLLLREQVQTPAQAPGAPLRAAGQLANVRSILWVDDYPKNNSVIVDHLNRMGIETITARSTAEAIALLERRSFDRIISDMGRADDVGNEKAGVELVKTIRGRLNTNYQNVPIVIYCSVPAAQRFGEEAKQAGARAVTPSQTELIEALKLYE
jgi:CheY-like chemotaxis protein